MAEPRTWLAVALAFGGTLVLLHLLVPLARRIGLVDRPGAIKVHDEATPLVGGLAVFIAFTMGLTVVDMPLTPYRALLLAGALLVIVGVLDDFRELSSRSRFGFQIGAALLMCYWGEVRLEDMGWLRFDGSLTTLAPLQVPLTVFCVVGVINALNMCDGLDGLGAGLAAIALASLAAAAVAAGQGADARVLLVALAATGAFWLVNTRAPGRARAPAFMGDAGSLFLGFLLAWFVVDLTQDPGRAMAPVQALWFLALPLLDTVRLLVWRAALGRSPFRGDQEHLHHVLRRAGLGHGASVALLLGVASLLAGAGWILPLWGVSELHMFLAFMALFTAYSLVLGIAWWRGGLFGVRLQGTVRADSGDRRARAERRAADRRTAERRAGGDRRDGD